MNALNNTFDVGQLAFALGHLDTERFDFENGDITANDLALEVILVLDGEGVLAALFLDLTGTFRASKSATNIFAGSAGTKNIRLDRVVFEMTVLTLK